MKKLQPELSVGEVRLIVAALEEEGSVSSEVLADRLATWLDRIAAVRASFEQALSRVPVEDRA